MELCVACAERRGAVLGSDVSAGGLIADSFRIVTRYLPTVLLFALVEALATQALARGGILLGSDLALSLGLMLVSAAFRVVIEASWISLLAAAARGTPMTPLEALRAGLPVSVPLFFCNVVFAIAVMFGLVLLIIPGIVLALGFSLAATAVVASRRGPIDALGESWGLSEGHRVSLLLAFLATGGIGIVVNAAFAAGLAGGLSFVSLPGSAIVLAATSSLVGTLTFAPMITVPVLAYLRLQSRLSG
ncbi:MAG: hypothetical protein ACOZQL_42400 [Myxococcota bacterium]